MLQGKRKESTPPDILQYVREAIFLHPVQNKIRMLFCISGHWTILSSRRVPRNSDELRRIFGQEPQLGHSTCMLYQKLRYRSYSISKNSSSLFLSLLACTEDRQCTDDDDKNVCDTTRNVCVGKINNIHFVRVQFRNIEK